MENDASAQDRAVTRPVVVTNNIYLVVRAADTPRRRHRATGGDGEKKITKEELQCKPRGCALLVIRQPRSRRHK